MEENEETVCRKTEEGICCEGYILAPSYGRVQSASKEKIAIFIPYEENHFLFSPIDGKITDIKMEKGTFEKEVFKAKVMKRMKVTLDIDGDIPLSFASYVGFPYRPKRIRIDAQENQDVLKGEEVGEILLGSLSETYFPENVEIIPLVGMFDPVIGGKTKIAKFRVCKEETLEL